MGSHDLVTTLESSLTSRSCETMDYATYNVRYQENFNISKTRTRAKYGGKELQNSMLAYTNYVVERQNRHPNSHPENVGRRHSIEINEDIHSRQVSNSSKFPGINLPFSKIPVLNKHKSGGPPRLIERYNRFKSEQGILRGHTFPPLNGTEKTRSRKPVVRISVATVSDLYDVTNRTRCEAKVSEVINHEKLHAWLATDQASPEPDLSNILTTSKPAIKQQAKVTFKPGKVTNSTGSGDDYTEDWYKARNTVSSNSSGPATSSQEDGGDFSEGAVNDSDNVDSPRFAKKKQSEELLKSAIKTLKLMEKELEELPKKATKVKEKSKKKKSSKKSRRLMLPEQTLDIIPELECETQYARSPDGGYSSEVSPACVHYSSKRSDKVYSEFVDDDNDNDEDYTDDGIDRDIDDEQVEGGGAGAVVGSFGDNGRFQGETEDFYSFKGITGRGIGHQSVPALPPIGKHQRGVGTLVQGQAYSSVSKLDKVKHEIRNKIKRRHKHLQ